MTSTYFASATWYDDGDESFHITRHEPRKGKRLPDGGHGYFTDPGSPGSGSYHLKDERLCRELSEKNKIIMECNRKKREREYIAFHKYVLKNIYPKWLGSIRKLSEIEKIKKGYGESLYGKSMTEYVS